MSETDTVAEAILAREYVELLMLPFRLVRPYPPYQVEAFSMQAVAARLDELGERTSWKALPVGNIPVALPGKAQPLGAACDFGAWQQHQAVCYFHPAVRSFLFGSMAIASVPTSVGKRGGSNNDYHCTFRRDDVKRLKVVVWNDATKQRDALTFKVLRCDLALFQPDVGILQLELHAEIGETGLPLSNLLRVRDEVRRLFPPYALEFPVWRGGHCPLEVSWSDQENGDHWNATSFEGLDALEQYLAVIKSNGADAALPAGLPRDVEALPIFGHWKSLLGTLSEDETWKLLPPGDDRLPSLAFIAVDDPRLISPGDWVRLGLSDAHGTDVLPYARTFLAGYEERYCYDRFWHDPRDSIDYPSRIMNCGYAFTMVGSAADHGFFLNPRDGAWVTFRQIYARMGLLAQFQKAAMLGALARLSCLAWREPDGGLRAYDSDEMHSRIRRFYREFLEFTQVYWFEEVSPQLQGVELFSRWQRELRTKELYKEVRQELTDLVEYVNASAELEQSKSALRQAAAAERFTRVAVWLGGIGVVAGILGMNILPDAIKIDLRVLQRAGFGEGPTQLPLAIALLIGTSALIIIVGAVAYYWETLVVSNWRRLTRRLPK